MTAGSLMSKNFLAPKSEGSKLYLNALTIFHALLCESMHSQLFFHKSILIKAKTRIHIENTEFEIPCSCK